MRKSFILVLMMMLFLLGGYSVVEATETGKIIGIIKDANKKALPNVTVTVTSPNLMGERTMVTNKKGRFTMPELPIGIYLLQFEHEDKKTIKRPDVKILPYATVKVKLTMTEGSPEDVEVLSGPSDLIDVQSSGHRQTMESDFLQRLPGAGI